MKISDIAKLAGVSKSTVSRVLNNTGYVKRDTKRRVLDVIKNVNYVPNNIARSLSKKHNNTVAVVVPDIENPYFSEIIKGITEVADENDINLLLYDTNESIYKEEKIFNDLLGQRPKGAIICISSNYHDDESLEILENSKIPFVLFDRELKSKRHSGIFFDDFKGGYLATENLIKEDHKKIAVITGPLTSSNGYERLEGYKKALKDNNIKVNEDIVFEGDFKLQSGYEYAKEIILNKKEISAIFSCNSLMTLGVLAALNELGMKTPEDISLVGYDNPEYFDILGVNVSSIKRAVKKMGRISLEMLLEITNKKDDVEKERIVLDPELILRGSEKKIKK